MKGIARVGRSKVWNKHRGRGLISFQSIFISLRPFVFLLCWLPWSSREGCKWNYPWSGTITSSSVWLRKRAAPAACSVGSLMGEDELGAQLEPWAHAHADAQVLPVWQCIYSNLLESTLASAKTQQVFGSSLKVGPCSFGHVDTLGEILRLLPMVGKNTRAAKTPNCGLGFRTCWNDEVSDSDTHGSLKPFVPKIFSAREHYWGSHSETALTIPGA